MTFQESLSKWRTNLARMSRNISDLEEIIESPEYVGMKARMRSIPEPEGEKVNSTNFHARIWRQSNTELWECVKLVGEFIDRADNMVKLAWPWQKESVSCEATKILEMGVLELNRGSIPVLTRNLLDDSNVTLRLNLQQMMEFMETEFQRGKSSLTNLVQSSQVLDKEILRIEKKINTEGWQDNNLMQEVQDIKLNRNEDPVLTMQRLKTDIIPAFEEAYAKAQKIKQVFTQSVDILLQVKNSYAELEILMQESENIYRQAAEKVTVLPVGLVDRKIMIDLYSWLERLEKSLSKDKLDSWNIGMAKWKIMYQNIHHSILREKDECIKIIARREELRYRLDALRVKRNVRLFAGSEKNTKSDSMLLELTNTLFGNITDMNKAESLLREFEIAVAAMPRNGKG